MKGFSGPSVFSVVLCTCTFFLRLAEARLFSYRVGICNVNFWGEGEPE